MRTRIVIGGHLLYLDIGYIQYCQPPKQSQSICSDSAAGRHCRIACHQILPTISCCRLWPHYLISAVCAQVQTNTIVKIVRVAPPHLPPQGAWLDHSHALHLEKLNISFSAVRMPQNCLDRPKVTCTTPGRHVIAQLHTCMPAHRYLPRDPHQVHCASHDRVLVMM